MDDFGSRKPLVILSYHNCEIYCCHLDGYGSNTEALLNRMSEIEAIFLSKPSHAQFRIWYNLDENCLDKQTIERIAKSIFQFRKHIYKIALLGLYGLTKWKFHRVLEQTLVEKRVPTAYFSDAELAKGWLV